MPGSGMWVFWYTVLGTLAALVLVVKGVLPIWRGLKSFAQRASGALDNIGGRDEFVDPTTGKTVERIPAIGERFTDIETKLDGLANTDARLDSLDARATAAEARLNEHDTAIGMLSASALERSAEAQFRTAELAKAKNQDIIDVDLEP